MEKALEDELNNLEANPKSKPKKAPQDPWKLTPPKDLGDLTKAEPHELEDEIHSMEKMASVTVMEEEIRVMGELVESSKEFADVYTDKKELLEYRKDMIVQNIQNGFINVGKYTEDMKKELEYEKNLLKSLGMSKCNAADVKRVEKRIELLGKEIADCEGMEAEPEEEPEAKAEGESKAEAKVEAVEGADVPSAVNNAVKSDEKHIHKEEEVEEIREDEEVKAESKEEDKESLPIQELPAQSPEKSFVRLTTIDPSFFLDDEEDEKDIDFTQVNKKQYDAIVQRREEYREATAYLMENGFIEQSQKLLKKIEQLSKCLRLIVRDKKKVDLLKIEPPLTPELMFDCSKEKRDQLYNEMILQLQKQAVPLHKKLEAFKKLSKKDRTRLAQQMLPVAKKHKEAELMINTLKAHAKNPWAPVPVCHIEPVFKEVDITNKDIKSNILSVEYVPDAKMSKKDYYVLYYKLKHNGEAVRGSTEGYVTKKIDIQFPKGAKSVSECILTLKLQGRKYFLFKPYRAKLKLKLEELEHANEIKHQVPEFRNKYVINATIKVRLPGDGRTTKTVEGKELIVNKIYKPFRGHIAPVIAQAPAATGGQKAASAVVKAPAAKAPATAVSVAAPSKTEAKPAPKADPALPKQLELPPNVTVQDVMDPDNVANLVCVSYLDKRITYYNNLIQETSKQGKKVPDSVAKVVNQMVKNKATIEGQIERGVLTAENYKSFLQMQLDKDKSLLECLAKYKQERKAGIVKERIECLQSEINSL